LSGPYAETMSKTNPSGDKASLVWVSTDDSEILNMYTFEKDGTEVCGGEVDYTDAFGGKMLDDYDGGNTGMDYDNFGYISNDAVWFGTEWYDDDESWF